MDSTTGGVLGIIGFLVSAAGAIYAAINHKRVRCRCCGKDMDVSVDIDSTEEEKKKPVEVNTEEEEEEEEDAPPRRSQVAPE
jgi:hypothetical protein